jgi:hypothetical protein
MKIRQGILKVHDLCPDGVRIIVNWERMVTSSSVFIQCINTQAALHSLVKIAEDKGWQVETQVCIENNKLGVRMWRIV